MATQLKKNNTDRWIVIGGALILIAAVGFLTFDDWFWNSRRTGGDTVGEIASRSGDVRVKYAGEVKWQKANQGEQLIYNDTIFSGAHSQAGLTLGKSSITLSENSLVVIRRQDDAKFLALSYGSLTGKVNGGDKILIDTGDGKPVLLEAKTDTEISLKKSGDKTELKLLKGAADLNHKALNNQVQALNPKPAKAPPPPPPPVKAAQVIQIVKPKPGELVYSKDELAMNFEWTYGGKSKVDAKDRFTIEFSKTPGFELLEATRVVDGKNADVVRARHSIDLFYRVRGPKNELSKPDKFSFIRLSPPVIVSPANNASYSASAKVPANVPVEVHPLKFHPLYWMQIASDEAFKTVLVNESHPNEKSSQVLPSGVYYLRARADYGGEHLSDWSEPVHFRVKERAHVVKPRWAFQNSVLIPNKPYPETFYSSNKRDVEAYLAAQGFLADFFDPVKSHADQIVLDYMDGSTPKATKLAWPAEKMEPKPRAYTYRYQIQKRGRLPSPWSAPEKLSITLEPPHGTHVDPHAGDLTKDGKVPVKVQFTPLLFASSYEVQIAQNSTFLTPKDWRVNKPELGFYALRKHVYYWRARALNEKGEPISDFSFTSKVNSGDFEPAIIQAQRDAAEKRQPASTPTNTSTAVMRDQGSGTRVFENPGFWMWAGSGLNFVDYNQSISGRGTYDSKSVQPMGAYLEFGWGDGHVGAVMTYKNTPGQLIVSNAPVTSANFSWQTLSAEGLYCPVKQSATLFGKPVTLGLRAGFQYQEMPFYFLNFNRTLVSGDVNMLDASLGMMAEMSIHRWRYYWLMRYQYPLSSSAPNNSTFDPKFAFDGSVGAAYYLSRSLKAGVFWYGQWQQFDFVSSDATVQNSGSQMLFYSAVDLRLGYDF